MMANGEWRMANGSRSRFVAAVLVVAALAGCDYFTYTSVKDLLAAPGKFEGTEVKIKGTVTEARRLPLLNVQTYTVQDGDAKIAVIALQGPLPAVNDTVKLKGTVKSSMILEGKAVGQRVEETQRLK
jgi:hypothetical protein